MPDQIEHLPPDVQDQVRRIADSVERIAIEAVSAAEIWEALDQFEAVANV